jgi:hypothetical protein
MARGPSRYTTPSKPPKSSHMMSEENEEFENMLSQLKQVEEMSGSMLKLEDYSCSQEIFKREMDDKIGSFINHKMEQMEKKVNKNKDQMEKKMDENRDQMENKLDSILQTLDGRLTKSDIVTEETHENKCSIHLEQPANNK